MILEQFKKDVEEGFAHHPKTISSKYFYDKTGDALFVKIMNMPEYYLTRAEHEIFKEQTSEIIKSLNLHPNQYFELIELGAGDGTKTKELLKILDGENFQFDYLPVDISINALEKLENALSNEIPNLNVKIQQGDYFEVLASLKDSPHPKVVLFLGSNIGNLSDDLANKFIYQLGANLKPLDKLFLGVDLIKPASVVLPAYNDAQGITRDFNLNLLERMNRELDADFDINSFLHVPEYLEEEGIARSFIESQVEQNVTIKKIGKTFCFKKGERIHTEISRKYSDEIINNIITNTDFKITGKLTDSNHLFADYILTRG